MDFRGSFNPHRAKWGEGNKTYNNAGEVEALAYSAADMRVVEDRLRRRGIGRSKVSSDDVLRELGRARVKKAKIEDVDFAQADLRPLSKKLPPYGGTHLLTHASDERLVRGILNANELEMELHPPHVKILGFLVKQGLIEMATGEIDA